MPIERRLCLCGCGGTTRGGGFLPGHDGRLNGFLRNRIEWAADRDAADELVERGWLDRSEADTRVAEARQRIDGWRAVRWMASFGDQSSDDAGRDGAGSGS